MPGVLLILGLMMATLAMVSLPRFWRSREQSKLFMASYGIGSGLEPMSQEELEPSDELLDELAAALEPLAAPED